MISIHAPVKGATRAGERDGQERRDFNPRSREGSDPRLSGCTTEGGNFNPRSREGSDASSSEDSGCRGFQSTLP